MRSRKQNKRRRKAAERAEAYQDRVTQRLQDKVLGPGLRQQMDVRQPLRSLSVSKLAKMDELDQAAWKKSVAATLDLLPEGYVPVVDNTAIGIDAVTHVNSFQKKVSVRYDPDLDPPDWDQDQEEEDGDERIGRLTQTFTHELAVHGNRDGIEPEDEHVRMYDPTTRDRYLAATHDAFNQLDNEAQQVAFAREWAYDLSNQIAAGPARRRAAAAIWRDEQERDMLAAAERPERHAWTKKNNVRAGGYTAA